MALSAARGFAACSSISRHIKLCLLLWFEFFRTIALLLGASGIQLSDIQNRARQTSSDGEKFSVEQIFTQG